VQSRHSRYEHFAIIAWNLIVIAIVLAAVALAPAWPSVVGAATALLLNRIGPSEWRCEIGLRRPPRFVATLLGGVAGGIALFFFTRLFLQHLCEIVTHSERDLSAFDFARGHLRTVIPLITQIALTAGFCEEVVYRGTIIPRLEAIFARKKERPDRLPRWKTGVPPLTADEHLADRSFPAASVCEAARTAACRDSQRRLSSSKRAIEVLVLFVSAAIFAAAHSYQGPAGVMMTGLIGLLLGFVYIVSGRILWPVVLIHLTYDFLSLTAISLNLDRVLQGWSLALFSWLARL